MNKTFLNIISSFILVTASQFLNIYISRHTGIFPVISISGGIICWLFFLRGFKITLISSTAGIITAVFFSGHNYLYLNLFYSSNNILVSGLIYYLLKKTYADTNIVNTTASVIRFFTISALSSFIFIIPQFLYLNYIVKASSDYILTIASGSCLSVFTGVCFFPPFLILLGRDIKELKITRFMESITLYLISIVISFLILFNYLSNFSTDIMVFLLIPLIILCAFRVSPSILSISIFSIGFIAVKSTLMHKSNFSNFDHYSSMILIQFFFILSYISVVIMKSLIYEKDMAILSINELNNQLEDKVKKRTENLKNTLIKLRNTKKIYKNIFDNAGDGIFRITSQGKILNLNKAALDIFGYLSMEEVKLLINDQNLSIFLSTSKRDQIIKKIEVSNQPERFEFEALKKNNEKIWIQAMVSKEIKKDDSFIMEGIIRDITKEKSYSEKLIKKAFTDPLTDIYNREALYDKINLKIRNLENFSLFFMDMDGFKIINDKLGHDSGDEILKIITKRILKSIRESDIVARFGGDEFVLLINNLNNIEDIEKFSTKLIDKLSSPYRLEGGLHKLGVSIGISRFPIDSESANDLISKADQAMYISKKNGKNRWTLFKRENYERT